MIRFPNTMVAQHQEVNSVTILKILKKLSIKASKNSTLTIKENLIKEAPLIEMHWQVIDYYLTDREQIHRLKFYNLWKEHKDLMNFYLTKLKKINNVFKTCNKFSKELLKILFSTIKIIPQFIIIHSQIDQDRMSLSILSDNPTFWSGLMCLTLGGLKFKNLIFFYQLWTFKKEVNKLEDQGALKRL